MRICMLNITSGGMSGGYKTYLSNLVPRLAVHPEIEALLVGTPESVDCSEWRKRAPSAAWLPLKSTLCARGREVGPKAREAIGNFAPDVIFIPTARYFTLDDTPVVNMIRNMMPTTLGYTAYCLEWARNWARLRQMRIAVRRSNRVIAISQFVKDYLSGELGIAKEKIGVVYHGSESNGNQAAERPGVIPADWSGRFVFTAGLIYPYRGLEDLIEAWSHLRCFPDRPPLVIAGKVGQGMSRYYARLQRLVRERNLESHVQFAGVLTRPEMEWCYRHCSMFVMTSRIEACPNIALETMGHACLCVSTDNPPMPEIFGDAARYYSAGDADALAKHILHVLQLPSDRQEQIRRLAVARASQFTWETCCHQTVCELRKVLPP